ncbi:PIN domain nuclease [Rhodopila globiformis]|uniref:PIN domain nuclease n=1 Tax=Rhodopila globiformis TaxID=1071 RepID=A0A2S6NLA9_RHOGL|nr:PIN domain nuclease [Rhodopila globiformis]
MLDTHVALWAIADDDRLSAKARRLIDDEENDIVVSAATVWEISIKHALARSGPNDMPISGEEALGYFKDAGFELLNISPAHAAAVEALPPLHADPFDRILIAQALTTPLRLLTHDQRIVGYSDLVIAV